MKSVHKSVRAGLLAVAAGDLPPLKWSSLMYVFDGDHEIWGATVIQVTLRPRWAARPMVKPLPFGAPPPQQQVDTAN
jgi:hypothetical protein